MIGVLHPLVFFPTYEHMKIHFKNNFEEKGAKKLSTKYILMSSVLSKLVSSVVSYPHEVLRARMQYQKNEVSTLSPSDRQKPEGLGRVMSRMVRNEGPLSLYSGFTLNIARIIPTYAITFVLYENLCYHYGISNQNE